MRKHDGSSASGPRIVRLKDRIETLYRRLDYLEDVINRAAPNAPNRLDREKAEAAALRAAIWVMEYHHAALDRATDPVEAVLAAAGLLRDLRGWGVPARFERRVEGVLARLEQAAEILAPDDDLLVEERDG